MKRWLYIIFVLALLLSLSNFVIAQDAAAQAPASESTNTFKERSNEFLEKDIIIPEDLQGIARVVFGLKAGETIDFSVFIVLIALLVILFLIIREALTFAPIFGAGFKSWLGSLVLTLLVAISGAVKETSIFLFETGEFFKFVKGFSFLNIIFILILLGLFFYGFFMMTKIIKHQARKEKRRMSGFKAVANK